MSFADLIVGVETVSASIQNPESVMTGLDANLNPIYTASTPITTTAVLTHLTSSELAARNQIQDNSQYKLVINDNTTNRTINHTFEVTIDSIPYTINGDPKKQVLSIGWITLYISKK